jgi:hypothetical protein
MGRLVWPCGERWPLAALRAAGAALKASGGRRSDQGTRGPPGGSICLGQPAGPTPSPSC